jgi:hypothetical protein
MDVVAHLLAFVAEDLVLAALDIALDQVAQKAVQLHAGMVRTREAAAAQAAGGHVEIAAVFLHHHVAGDLGSAKQGVLALVDGKSSGMPCANCRIGVVPAGLEFLQRMVLGRSP